jgi:predicted nuclease of restriction endonuclease-like RecB superfamily
VLTKDLLRFKISDGRILPTLLRGTPANVELAQRLLDYWRQGIGQRRGELEDGALPILHQSRALLIGRGMQKLILDDCGFADPPSSETLRGEALAASAALFAAPAASVEMHRALVAERIGLPPEELAERLYGDLPDAARLESCSGLTPERLIERYNLSLCQGLLLHAKGLDVVVRDADTGLRRRLLKALRFRRLLAEVVEDGTGILRLAVSGPGSVLDQASRYGLQLALFLPALACARQWTATATLAPPRRAEGGREAVRLELSDATGLVGDSAFLGHVPEELRALHEALAGRFPSWRLEEPQLLPLPGGELVVPDLHIVSAGRVFPVELFHRWHGHALARRLEQLARGLAPRLVVGIDRALARTTAVAPLLEQTAFLRHGFLFSDLPVPRALGEVVERLMAGKQS